MPNTFSNGLTKGVSLISINVLVKSPTLPSANVVDVFNLFIESETLAVKISKATAKD